MTTEGQPFSTEESAKEAADKNRSPFVVALPDGAGFAWFATGEHSPRGSRALARWTWVKTEIRASAGRRAEHRGRKGWKDVRFGEHRSGLR